MYLDFRLSVPFHFIPSRLQRPFTTEMNGCVLRCLCDTITSDSRCLNCCRIIRIAHVKRIKINEGKKSLMHLFKSRLWTAGDNNSKVFIYSHAHAAAETLALPKVNNNPWNYIGYN